MHKELHVLNMAKRLRSNTEAELLIRVRNIYICERFQNCTASFGERIPARRVVELWSRFLLTRLCDGRRI